VDVLRRLQAKPAAEMNALLPAILDKAFKGELSPRTTKLYDRRNDEITLDEIERILI
jgi:hypothetical protein